MCFSFPSDIRHLIESKYNVEQHLKIYDHFVERQMSCTQSLETQNFLLPIWKLRSSFNDALRPVEENMIDSMLGSKMLLATNAIKEGRIYDGNVLDMIEETSKCYHIYQEYIKRLKRLYCRTKYIYKTASHHKLNVLDEYAEVHNFDPVAIRHHYNRIVYVLEMSIVIADSIQDALRNARSVVDCAKDNMDIMRGCYDTITLLEQIEARRPSLNPCETRGY